MLRNVSSLQRRSFIALVMGTSDASTEAAKKKDDKDCLSSLRKVSFAGTVTLNDKKLHMVCIRYL
jgi:hypothetical protein